MNDFDSILARMKADMPPDITVIEGSLAGDILTAVANELAKFYDMEVKEIYDKAFVTTATGDYLTNACLDYGVERNEGESDESLRERTLYLIKNQASSGNEAHYIRWVRSFPEVKAVHLKKGSDGSVSVYIISDSADEALLANIAAYIEENRPIGAKVTVNWATERLLNMSVDVTVMTGYTTESVKPFIQAMMDEYYASFSTLDTPAFISISRIKNMILDLEGISDVNSLSVDNVTKSFNLEPGQYPAMGNLYVS
ncbi:MAG: baseplate J/gp47 family protein [Clostridia bacterium]|nr:baseplate J/gp47 family protein [Clostridia bacterium]